MSLEDLVTDLETLTAPQGATGPTLPGTTRPSFASHPKGWEPGVRFEPNTAMVVTTTAVEADLQRDEGAWKGMVEDLGLTVPDGWRVRLVEAKYDPVAWTRDTPDQDKAVTRAVWRYRFAVEPDDGAVHDLDVEALTRDVVRRRRQKRAATATTRGLVVVYADPQAGKVDQLGGTPALAARVAQSVDLLEDHIAGLKKIGRAAQEAAWVDGGDCVEGFQNVKSQAQTNDLTLTRQVRAHRRFTFHGLDFLADRFDKVTAVTAGSNHARVREGKDVLADPSDDWGIEVMSQVQDAYKKNPDAYGHVTFAYPPAWRDTTLVDIAGVPIGLAHGHQAGRSDGIPKWWKDQAFGEEPVAPARVLISGHFHHWRTQQVGNGRLWVQAPTIDNGSSWYATSAGEVSHPGLLVFSVTEHGWDDMRILTPDF